ncbi:hypothetical protein WJX73_000271 [Symbiochloris irregularis]|uniref:Uncharacterized protein n=1 Tax=Symbiochloris irregularis TaxID=706552 RepID=A0AAW1PBN8_9CHLO
MDLNDSSEIVPGLFCGAHPKSAMHIEALHKQLGITHIISLAEAIDRERLGIESGEWASCAQRLAIAYHSCPAREWDPHTLQQAIPHAAGHMHRALQRGGRVYVHCKAGQGRAGSACIAYLFWFHHFNLAQARQHFMARRPYDPNTDCIRGATMQLLSGAQLPLELPWPPPERYAHLNAEERRSLQHSIAKLHTDP